MSCNCILSPGKKVGGLPTQLRPRFLSGLSEDEVNSVLSSASHRQFHASSVVINQDDSANRFFMLTSGYGRHFLITDEGRKIILHWLTAGRIFGGVALVSTPMRYLLSTELLSDSCALVWERQAIRDLAVSYPKLLDNAISIAATDHVPWLISAHASLSSENAQGRVAHLLESLASAIGKETSAGVEMSVTNEDLAEGANVTPFTVSRCLSSGKVRVSSRKAAASSCCESLNFCWLLPAGIFPSQSPLDFLFPE